MTSKLTALVPFKPNSRRLPNKNLLSLHDQPLISYIFDTLLGIEEIDGGTFCFSSDENILKFLNGAAKLLMRPPRLNEDRVKARELFSFAAERLDTEWILLCHPTGPLVLASSLKKAINACLVEGYDSACSVQRIQNYCWLNGKPLNYQLDSIPQTQDLEPVFVETSGFYLFKKSSFLSSGKRLNGKVSLIEVDEKESVDIDEAEDFELALNHLKPRDFKKNDGYLSLFKKMKRPKIEHVAFDLDGVLIDSLEVMRTSWTVVNEKLNIQKPFEAYAKHIGRPFFDILLQLEIPKTLWNDIKKIYDEVSSALISKIKIFHGVTELVKTLQQNDIEVSIVTSKPETRTIEILKWIGLENSITTVVTPDSVATGRGKPSADPLLLACMHIKKSPANTIYIGDMLSDYQCALNANIDYAHAGWGYQPIGDNSVKVFRSPNDLGEWVIGENSFR